MCQNHEKNNTMHISRLHMSASYENKDGYKKIRGDLISYSVILVFHFVGEIDIDFHAPSSNSFEYISSNIIGCFHRNCRL